MSLAALLGLQARSRRSHTSLSRLVPTRFLLVRCHSGAHKKAGTFQQLVEVPAIWRK